MSKSSAKKLLESLNGEILPKVEELIPPTVPRYAGYCEKIEGSDKLELNLQLMMGDFLAFAKASGIPKERLLSWLAFSWEGIEAAKIAKQ